MVDAFLLGYLPHLVRAHFAKLTLFDAVRADPAFEARVAQGMEALVERGPEIVSCVWQLERILGERLLSEPPPPPKTAEECARWMEAVVVPGVARWGTGTAERAAFELGGRVGAAEADLDLACWVAELGEGSAYLAGRAEELATLRADAATRAEDPVAPLDWPVVRTELVALAAALRAEPSRERQRDVGFVARGLEAAVAGTPRDAIRAWQEKRLSGLELRYRLLEHRRWSVPVRMREGGSEPEPRVFVFDKRVLIAFSDANAVRDRPQFLRSDAPDDNLLLTLTGYAMFLWLPDPSVDLIVLDPTDDPSHPGTIHYPSEMHAGLHQTADEVKLDLAIADWSHLDVETIRAAHYWILLEGSTVHHLITQDGFGRTRVGVYTAEACLDAHLARATPEQRAVYDRAERRLLPGTALFPALHQLDVNGLIVNPHGPGRSRPFNRKTLEILAGARTPSAT